VNFSMSITFNLIPNAVMHYIQESKIKLSYIPHNPKNKEDHPVLSNIERILYEQEEEER